MVGRKVFALFLSLCLRIRRRISHVGRGRSSHVGDGGKAHFLNAYGIVDR